MKKLVVALFALMISVAGMSQSVFKPIPKPVQYQRLTLTDNTTTPLPDSTFTGFRPVVSAAVYGYTKSQGNSLFTGAGISYEKDTYNVTTQKWYTDWSVGALVYAGGTAAPTGITTVEAVGLNVSFFNKLVSLGAAYNIQAKAFMPTVGISVSLNN